MLAECGALPLGEDAVGRMVGEGAATLVARAFAAADVPQPEWALARFLEVYESRPLRHTRPYAGMLDAVASLDGAATLAVLTNKPIGPTRVILDSLGFSPHFGDRVLGGDGPHARKPDPAGLRQLMTGAGAAPDVTLMVGDSIIDWHTARAADVACAFATYGFGAHAFPIDTLRPGDFAFGDSEEFLKNL